MILHLLSSVLKLRPSAVRRRRALCLAPKRLQRRCRTQKRMGTAKPGASCTSPQTGESLEEYDCMAAHVRHLQERSVEASLPLICAARPTNQNSASLVTFMSTLKLPSMQTYYIGRLQTASRYLWCQLTTPCCRLKLKQRAETLSSHCETIAEAAFMAISRCDRLTDGLLTLAVAAAAVMADQVCYPT